jgi:hypothetical protein
MSYFQGKYLLNKRMNKFYKVLVKSTYICKLTII